MILLSYTKSRSASCDSRGAENGSKRNGAKGVRRSGKYMRRSIEAGVTVNREREEREDDGCGREQRVFEKMEKRENTEGEVVKWWRSAGGMGREEESGQRMEIEKARVDGKRWQG